MNNNIKNKNQRLRISLSIMVLSFCTVFIFLSNSAKAQITVDNVPGVNTNGTAGSVTLQLDATDATGNTYSISSINDLRALAKYAFTDICAGKIFKLTIDLDFTSLLSAQSLVYDLDGVTGNESNMFPIGGWTSETTTGGTNKHWKGSFDGGGHTITGLRILFPTTVRQYAGLFGTITSSTSYIKDLHLKDIHIQGGGYVGGFIAATHAITISNCSVDGLTLTSSAGSSLNHGGFIGFARTYSSTDVVLVKNCYVTNANITGGSGFVGTAGQNSSTSGSTKFVNCYVINANLSSNVYAGGFVYNTNPCTSSLKFINCYTTAQLTASTASSYGPFYVATTNSATYTNCYYNSNWHPNATTTVTNTDVTSKTTSEMRADDFVTLLNGSTDGETVTAYKQDYAFVINKGFPIFTTQQIISPYIINNGEEIVVPSGTATTDIPSVITIEDGGSLIDNANIVSNNVTIQRKMKVGAWNLFGLTQNTTTGVGDILNNNHGVGNTNIHDMAAIKYDYSTNLWNTHYLGINEGNDYNTLNVGEGYFVWPLTTNTDGATITPTDDYTIVSQTATPYTSDILMTTLNLNNIGTASTGNTVNGLWFALSNPYLGRLLPSEICTSITNTQGESTVYTYNATSGVWETPAYVYPGQGFMVATTSATTLIGKLTKSARTSKASATTPSYITFTCQANNTTKEAFARISEQASNGFDQKDAYVLLSSNNEDLVEPYFLVENHAVLKNIYKTMPYYSPINFHASKVSNADLTVSNIPSNVTVSIVDLASGNETELTNGSAFNFTANQGENEGRFVVKFGKNNVGIENNAEENNISLAMYPNPATTQTTILVNGLTNDAKVLVNDIQGRTINTYTINKNQSTLKINTENLSSGIYYIRVVSNDLTKTEKLIVK